MRMAVALVSSIVAVFLTLAIQGDAATPGSALSDTYYDGLCPGGTKKFQAIALENVVAKVIADRSLIPSLLRMAFHDSFVQGPDASVLMDYDPSFPDVEKNAPPNNPSLRGFKVIDAVKKDVEAWCPGVVSCADIIQESARVAMKSLLLGSLHYDIRYGRRDGSVSLFMEALSNLPKPFSLYGELLTDFQNKGLNAKELMLLSGAHTFGVSHCKSFAPRLYDFYGNGSGTDPALDPTFAESLKAKCPENATVDDTIQMNQPSPKILTFDNQYYKNILLGRVLFTSDHELSVGDPNNVNLYAGSNFQFRKDFALALVKLTEVQVKLFPNGEIRTNCRKRNP